MSSSQVTLKLARRIDAKRIAHMSRDLVEDGLPWSWTTARVAEQIRHPESNVLTAWTEGKLIGFAIMRYLAEHAHLNLLAVDSAYRRLGIGQQLMEWLEETCRVGGLFWVRLEVRANNHSAQSFYRRLGYRDEKVLPGYYRGRESALQMIHDLSKHAPISRPYTIDDSE
ncbi:MAG: GNAT family N-acetyltransferase [Deltaproteobacteria bacterium]|nr:GNAT family N-acetyltransferase [Deltaproteobacteria bacterium]